MPYIVSSPTVVHNVSFPGKLCGVHVVRVNSRCKFTSLIYRFICGPCQIVQRDNTYGNFFPIYETHTYNGKQYCRPWSMVSYDSYACVMRTFPFRICVINCVRMWLYTYVHLCNHNNFALCTNADAIVTNRFTTVHADVYHGKPHSVPW